MENVTTASGLPRVAEGHFRHRLEPFKSLPVDEPPLAPENLPQAVDEEVRLRWEAILLREENARLRAGGTGAMTPAAMAERIRRLRLVLVEAEGDADPGAVRRRAAALAERLDQACLDALAELEPARRELTEIGRAIRYGDGGSAASAGDGARLGGRRRRR